MAAATPTAREAANLVVWLKATSVFARSPEIVDHVQAGQLGYVREAANASGGTETATSVPRERLVLEDHPRSLSASVQARASTFVSPEASVRLAAETQKIACQVRL